MGVEVGIAVGGGESPEGQGLPSAIPPHPAPPARFLRRVDWFGASLGCFGFI